MTILFDFWSETHHFIQSERGWGCVIPHQTASYRGKLRHTVLCLVHTPLMPESNRVIRWSNLGQTQVNPNSNKCQTQVGPASDLRQAAEKR